MKPIFDTPVTVFQYENYRGTMVDYSDPDIWIVKYSSMQNMVSVAHTHDPVKTEKYINLNALHSYKIRLGGTNETTIKQSEGQKSPETNRPKNTGKKSKPDGE